MAHHFTSRKQFLEENSVPTEATRDFKLDGIPVQYASGHPKEWESVDTVLDFAIDISGDGEPAHKSYYTAVSTDQELLAISSSEERVLIYDIRSRELRQVLEGAGHLAFRPNVSRDESMEVENEDAGEKHEKPAYTLVCSTPNKAFRGGPGDNSLILWDLDKHGRILDEEEPVDSATFARKAIDAIMPELTATHEWTKEFIDASILHKQFAEALRQVAVDHRRRHNMIIDDARLGSFGSTTFSNDGLLLLYHSRNRSTQQSMREPENLPQLVIYDIDRGMEVHRLSGHTDAIMWSSISPDNQFVASVSWDGTLRMYSTSTGALVWATDDSGGQSWAGAFSPDSKYIVWSSKKGRVIQVHDVVDGRKVSTFQETLNHWCRCLKWHPFRKQIAFCVGQQAYVWSPFEGPDGSTIQDFAMSDDNSSRYLANVQAVSWMDEGRLLCLEISDGTKVVYNTQTNTKELFMRTKGVSPEWNGSGFYGLFDKEGGTNIYLSVDGDGKVRYWRDSVAAFPSWWEKETIPTTSEKRPFPETGKYVKITKKTPVHETQGSTPGRDAWADKGAELWTAVQ